MNVFKRRPIHTLVAGSALTLALMGGVAMLSQGDSEQRINAIQSVIVQGETFAMVTDAVAKTGGKVTHELDIINAIEITPSEFSLVWQYYIKGKKRYPELVPD